MGHLNQTRQGKNSTSTQLQQEDKAQETEEVEETKEELEKTHTIMAAIQDTSHREGTAFGDLPGRYPVPSIHGHNYMLVIYHYDANSILVEPIKSINKGNILNTYRKIHTRLTAQGCKPHLQVLDNEASTILLEYLNKNKINVQLAPPHMHRQNLAE